MAGGRPSGEEEKERTTPSYLEEEDDVWGVPGPVAPPVIGELPRRGNE
ncbi:hypothetical protein [Saccharomonospora sp. CUA-673]|nr:hypothetical protein [Saccharomonospora sp. CUA-673]